MTSDTLAPSMALPAEQLNPAQTAETTTQPEANKITFADLGVDPRVVGTLSRLGIETPTLIQVRAIPALLAGRDVIGQSRTGSGKTIAYGLPLIERMDPRLRRIQALVLVPTRELAGQVANVLTTLGANRGLRVAQLIGGRSYLPQRDALRMGAQIAVGAPGRVLDHLRQGTLDLSNLTFAVLDEADQMLDAGFAPDVERLLSAMPAARQLALFTATLPAMTTEIASRFLHEPVSVDAGSTDGRPASTVTQTVYAVPREHRLPALMALLDRRREASGTTLVFGRTKHGVDKLARQLVARGYPVAALHGNMSQNARDRVLSDFRNGRSPMLLATNVAARGLDVLSIEQVINYELPESAELFTHRVGRTGRMDNTGEAITLLIPDDMAQWRRFQRDLGMKGKPQPWPLGALSIPAPLPTPLASETAEAEPMRADRFERRNDTRGEHRPERRFERRNEHRPEGRRFERAERTFEDRFERGQADERTQSRAQLDEDARPARREEVVNRWTRPAADADRRDDYRDNRFERTPERSPERGDDNRRDFRRADRPDDRREFRQGPDRREERREGRFGGERDGRHEGRRNDDRPANRGAGRGPQRFESQRPARPFHADGGPRRSGSGRPTSGRPARAHRPSRG